LGWKMTRFSDGSHAFSTYHALNMHVPCTMHMPYTYHSRTMHALCTRDIRRPQHWHSRIFCPGFYVVSLYRKPQKLCNFSMSIYVNMYWSIRVLGRVVIDSVLLSLCCRACVSESEVLNTLAWIQFGRTLPRLVLSTRGSNPPNL
jgi:hypothetical protein